MKMKNCIIITSYPSNEYRLGVLRKSLKSFQNFSKNSKEKFDIILCSQYPIVDKEILTLVDYFLYDNDNIESFFNYGDVYTYDFHYRSVINNLQFTDVFDNTYHFMLWKLVYMGLNFSNFMGYDFFYYMEGDFEISSENFLNKIIKLKIDTIDKDKDIVLFNLKTDNDELDFFLGVCWGGKIKEFLIKSSDIPFDKENWLKDNYFTSNQLERIMYDKIYFKSKDKINKILLENELSILREDEISFNKLHFLYALKTLFYFDKTQPDKLYVFLFNNDKEQKIIKIYFDDNIFLDMIFESSVYYYNIISISDIINKKIKWTIHQNDMLFFENEYLVDEKRLEIIKRKGLLFYL